MKARLRTETWRRLRLIAEAEDLPTPLAALDYIVEVASEKLFEADERRVKAAQAKRDKAKKSAAKDS